MLLFNTVTFRGQKTLHFPFGFKRGQCPRATVNFCSRLLHREFVSKENKRIMKA